MHTLSSTVGRKKYMLEYPPTKSGGGVLVRPDCYMYTILYAETHGNSCFSV